MPLPKLRYPDPTLGGVGLLLSQTMVILPLALVVCTVLLVPEVILVPARSVISPFAICTSALLPMEIFPDAVMAIVPVPDEVQCVLSPTEMALELVSVRLPAAVNILLHAMPFAVIAQFPLLVSV